MCSKLPNWVNSKLHIDDSEGVRAEGKRFHFRALVVDPLDFNWTEKVLAESISVTRMLERGSYRTYDTRPARQNLFFGRS